MDYNDNDTNENELISTVYFNSDSQQIYLQYINSCLKLCNDLDQEKLLRKNFSKTSEFFRQNMFNELYLQKQKKDTLIVSQYPNTKSFEFPKEMFEGYDQEVDDDYEDEDDDLTNPNIQSQQNEAKYFSKIIFTHIYKNYKIYWFSIILILSILFKWFNFSNADVEKPLTNTWTIVQVKTDIELKTDYLNKNNLKVAKLKNQLKQKREELNALKSEIDSIQTDNSNLIKEIDFLSNP